MFFEVATGFRDSGQRSVALIGMSGVGKTRIASLLRDTRWFHYSVDYRIGTRYMGEHIVDNFKSEAMKSPLLRELLLSDSIYIGSNITFHNLSPLSTYLGKPGDSDLGGIAFEEYVRRQRQHRAAELAAMFDTRHFIERAKRVYDYADFICDTSGSVCEVAEPDNPDDPLLRELSQDCLILYIREEPAHTEELARRFDKDPKPMYYNEDFLRDSWATFLRESGAMPESVDPDAFIRWGYRRLLEWRAPRYRAIARNWGYSVTMSQIADVGSESDFLDLIEQAIAERLESESGAPE